MKATIFQAVSAVLMAALASIFLLVPGKVEAQTVDVNGALCSSAYLTFVEGGVLVYVPAACGGNNAFCDTARPTFSLGKISIHAPPSCLTSSAGAHVPQPLQVVTVNGNNCIGLAQVKLDAPGSLEITVPENCQVAAPRYPAIVSFGSASASVGQTLVINGLNFDAGARVTIGGAPADVISIVGTTSITVRIPVVGLGGQPVIVTAGSQASALAVFNIVAAAPPVSLLAVKSRKMHGTLGPFEIDIDKSLPMNSGVTIEPRQRGTGHVIVFQFDGNVITPGFATAIDSTLHALAVETTFAGNEVYVKLTDATANQRVTITLAGVNGVSGGSASMGFLVGDINNSHTINMNDQLSVKAYAGQVATPSNFRHDFKASGMINAADIATVKARQGMSLVP